MALVPLAATSTAEGLFERPQVAKWRISEKSSAQKTESGRFPLFNEVVAKDTIARKVQMQNKPKKRGPKHPLPHEFYQEIGRKGGLAGRGQSDRGFGSTKRGKDGLTGPERARLAGAKGGRLSKRGPAKKK